MIKINENYLKLQASYLFSEIRRRTDEFQKKHPEREIIKLGIGDVTRPLPQDSQRTFCRFERTSFSNSPPQLSQMYS